VGLGVIGPISKKGCAVVDRLHGPRLPAT